MGIDPSKEYSINIQNDQHLQFIGYHRDKVFKK